ncbi:carbon catabolite repressor protein 4 homolog 2-like [Nymphaea colorata]|nr:carbon catabolite repressor protein 4 homolog 2-like [Nymphaea colorata]
MQSTVQCIECSDNPKIADVCSFHCNNDCYQDAWEFHLSVHDKAASSVKEDDIFAKIAASSASPSTSAGGQSSRTVGEGSGVELTLEVGRSKTYAPTDHDVGHGLKFECVVVDASTRTPASEATTVWTSTVTPAPCPRQRLMFLLHEATWPSSSGGPSAPKGTFTVLSYNILSDGRAKGGRYNYCPPWALSWSYRRQNLLREITGYRADVICLQQVQSNHFENFFAPELQKHGYKALYMANRTEEVRNAFAAETGDSCPVEGCATFFYKKRISLVKAYEACGLFI